MHEPTPHDVQYAGSIHPYVVDSTVSRVAMQKYAQADVSPKAASVVSLPLLAQGNNTCIAKME
eukprot:2385270-Pleurochrysis_carterae.AAC.2